MSKELETLRKEFNERIDVLLKKETNQLYKGWNVFVENDRTKWLILNPTIDEDGNVFCDGSFSLATNTWYNKVERSIWGKFEYVARTRPATESEIQEALIKEAEKRGFKEGVKFKTISGYNIDHSISKTGMNAFYNSNTDSLHVSAPESEWNLACSNPPIYKKGKWAEIIKEEEIKIGGYLVHYNAGNGGTTIDGHNFSKEFWVAAKTISEHSKAKIMVGCSKQFDVSLDTINKILKKLN